MESLSGPLHSRKLSNGNGFSNKNAYDGLLSGQRKFGSPNLSARTEDYREIFGSSQGVSSIPVLDLSGFDDPNGSSNLRSSKPDYSNIFGGFRDDDDGAVFYEELFGRVNGVKNSPEKASYDHQDMSYWDRDGNYISDLGHNFGHFTFFYHGIDSFPVRDSGEPSYVIDPILQKSGIGINPSTKPILL